MIEIEQALDLIHKHAHPVAEQSRALAESVNCVLAEDVVSDIDSPPYDKSMMDGYAVKSDDLSNETSRLRVVERIMAGSVPQKEVGSGTAAQIMTGASMPSGADTVVMIEQTEEQTVGGECVVEVKSAGVNPGQHILRKAEIFSAGTAILPAGHIIRAQDIGVLAEIGQATCSVFGPPRLSVVATGDELVMPDQFPNAGQIRNSNGPMLTCLANQSGCFAENLGISADTESDIRGRIQWGLSSDILLLSGGVSAGTADLVPKVLEELQVHQVFHKVRIKPGKPIWFGVYENVEHRCLVFGLPGNPASSLVGFQVFVKPAIRMLRGLSDFAAKRTPAKLESAISIRGGRPTYWPCHWTQTASDSTCRPLDWRGSADIRAVAEANCLGFFPAEKTEYSAGDQIILTLLDD